MVGKRAKFTRALAQSVSAVVAFMTAAVLVSFVFTVGPWLEGALLPVTKKLVISEVVPVDANTSDIFGTFEKDRNCDFVELKWYFVNSAGRGVGVSYEFKEASQIRAAGDHSFGPWEIGLRADLLALGSKVVAYHRCHWLWVTETVIYP